MHQRRNYGGGGADAQRAAAANVQLMLNNLPQQLAAATERIVRRNPIKISLNALGLALLFLFSGFVPSPEAQDAAEALLPPARAMQREYEARTVADNARAEWHASRGWFWTCDAACSSLKQRYEVAEAAWAGHAATNGAAVHASKARLGLLSVNAIAEARDLFWRAFSGGMQYAKRATMWDALFVGMRSMGRDEALANFLLSMFMRLLSNLTIGIFTGVVSFLWQVVAVARAYASDPISAFLFFAAAALVGVSFFVTSVVALAGTAAAVVVSTVSIARIGGGSGGGARQQRPQHLHYQ